MRLLLLLTLKTLKPQKLTPIFFLIKRKILLNITKYIKYKLEADDMKNRFS